MLDHRDLCFEVFPARGVVYFHHKKASLPGGEIEQLNRTIDIFHPWLALVAERQGRRVSPEVSDYRRMRMRPPRLCSAFWRTITCAIRRPVDLNVAFNRERETAD